MNRGVFCNTARRLPSATEIRRWLLVLLAPWTIFGCAKPPERPTPSPPRVTVQQPVEREIIDFNEYNGWTDASKTVEVRSRVRGHIKEVAFTDGQLVEKDQLLFQLDPDPFEAEFQAALKQVDVDQANLEFAQAEEDRDRELFEKKVTTKAELQKKVATRKSWEAQLQAAKEAVKRRQLAGKNPKNSFQISDEFRLFTAKQGVERRREFGPERRRILHRHEHAGQPAEQQACQRPQLPAGERNPGGRRAQFRGDASRQRLHFARSRCILARLAVDHNASSPTFIHETRACERK
jgi:pyruvate/2-oxoglutarate dehydrogenase complex dihydrolipoamide acyltransferase (E2) component